ncbi:MAG: hypothetical protein S4CHLAM37_15590 [Chlamydiia bacterium]|nr:hypothetical protein [Chlamydiia bacterium]
MKAINISNNNFNTIANVANPPKSQASQERSKAAEAFDAVKTTRSKTDKVINGSMGMDDDTTSKTKNLLKSKESIFGEQRPFISLQGRVAS